MAMNTIPLAMPADLLNQIKQTADDSHLSSADIMRQAIRAGLPKVRKSLAQGSRITNVEPLPGKVMDRIYRKRPADDGIAGIKELVSNQAFEGEE